jgi:hypothetical protein
MLAGIQSANFDHPAQRLRCPSVPIRVMHPVLIGRKPRLILMHATSRSASQSMQRPSFSLVLDDIQISP